jgi:hypothetical protein
MAHGTHVIRLVREQPVRSKGLMSPSSRVLRPIEGPPEETTPLLKSIMSRVRDQTGTSEDDIRFEPREGSRYAVFGPGTFLDRLAQDREVVVVDENGRDPFGL